MTTEQPGLSLDALRRDGRKQGVCKVAYLISTLSPENQQVLNEALSGPEFVFPSTPIRNAFVGLGLSIAVDPIIRHRRGQCRCKNMSEVIE